MKKTVSMLSLFLLLMLALLLACGCRATWTLPEELGEGTRALCLALDGPVPEATDLLSDAARAYCLEMGISVSLESEIDVHSVGQKQTALVLTDPKGRELTLSAPYEVVKDCVPPTITGARDRAVLLGEGAVLRAGVSVSDDCFGAVTLEIDTSILDTSRVGLYGVTYIARDVTGNETRQTVYVSVYEREISEQELWAACDAYLAELLSDNMSRENICRSIFDAVQRDLYYMPLGDKTDWVRVAYEALFVRGRGDCFSYFAAAKALLTRAGVPCLDIERSHAPGEETHFWLMVNLADEGEAARWYHFDPTELDQGESTHSGCLFTDAELAAYNDYRPGFYDYDRALYPPSAKESLQKR